MPKVFIGHVDPLLLIQRNEHETNVFNKYSDTSANEDNSFRNHIR